MIQTPEYGGGEIWFDKTLIRKDGRFVMQDLLALNPENLMNNMNGKLSKKSKLSQKGVRA